MTAVGVNNKQRRAAKQRRRATSGRPGEETQVGSNPGSGSAHEQVQRTLDTFLMVLVGRKVEERLVAQAVRALLSNAHPHPTALAREVLDEKLCTLVGALVTGGWGPPDLEQLVCRHAGAEHLPMLSSALFDDERRHDRGGLRWRAMIDAIGSRDDAPHDPQQRLASGLRVAALLRQAPILDPRAVAGADEGRTGADRVSHPKLAQVRALLAKAESTEFDEEADALTAKAQELITRYALDHLLARATRSDRGASPVVRRIWLDAPYVLPKAMLVHEVAGANRCQSACSESLGFCTVVGDAGDLDAVELLTTSLLVQAEAAMRRNGRRVDGGRTSRTRCFRRSFLIAYASRIGDRLTVVTQVVTGASTIDLLPVLRDQQKRVAEAFDAIVPNTTSKAATFSNSAGYVAGLAAADLAQLDAHGRLASHRT